MHFGASKAVLLPLASMSIGPGLLVLEQKYFQVNIFSLGEWSPKTPQEVSASSYRIQSRSFRIGMAFVVEIRMFHPFHC